VRPLVAALIALALVLATPAWGSEQHPTQSEIESELVCPTCHEPLDESTSPIAQDMKAQIRTHIALGWTKSEIENWLVAQPGLGPQILGVPRTHGFDLIAWVLPFTGIGLGAVGLAGGAWYWSHGREPDDPRGDSGPGLGDELERRVDDELAAFDA
jgi:cytochrome c-type biogenesis protein CcmH/NrfF